MLDRKRSRLAVVVLAAVVVLFSALTTESVYAIGGAQGAPTLFPLFTKQQDVVEGCPTVFLGALFPWNLFEGRVNLTVVDPPKGVSTTFAPNPVMLHNSDVNFTMLIVRVTPETPRGNNVLHIRVIPLPDSNYGPYSGENDPMLNTNVTIDVGYCNRAPISQYIPMPIATTTITTATTTILSSTTTTLTRETTQTQTSTSTATLSTTLTSTTTTTSTEQAADTSTYAWAVSATVAAVVLAVVVLLQKRH